MSPDTAISARFMERETKAIGRESGFDLQRFKRARQSNRDDGFIGERHRAAVGLATQRHGRPTDDFELEQL